MPKWGISVGEHSGDALGAEVLSLGLFNVKWEGTGGPKMQALGFSSQVEFQTLNVSGFTAVLPKLPKLIALKKWWQKKLASGEFERLVLIDYAEFNLQLAQLAKKFGVPVFFLAPPQMWAWRENRKVKLQGVFLGTLFGFESQLYKEWGLLAEQIGFHGKANSIEKKNGTLALYPGSRPHRYKNQAPVFQIIANWCLEEGLFEKCIWIAPDEPTRIELKNIVEGEVRVSKEKVEMEFALTVPGTNALFLAMKNIPFLAVMKVSKGKLWMGNRLLKGKSTLLSNWIQKEKKYPEVFFTKFSPNLKASLLQKVKLERQCSLEMDYEELLQTKTFKQNLKNWLDKEHHG